MYVAYTGTKGMTREQVARVRICCEPRNSPRNQAWNGLR